GQVPAATYRRALECLVTFDRRATLAHIRVPTLLLSGEFDRNAPSEVMRKMAAAIAHSTFIEMKGVGHLMNLEAPEDFDGLVLNFLALPSLLLH
ncbi:MAG: alpha/beta hydrolase, partial [Comamonadaceae bacterium]